MAEKVDVASISKFDGKNYPQWRFQMICVLKAKGVFDITCGIEKRPAATETNAATLAKWSKDDAIAMFTLTAGREISQITLVESCGSSKAILDKLDSAYQQKSEFNKMMILDRFHQVKMNSNESIAQHVAKVEILARQVKESSESLSDIAIITKILSTLPTKYRNFRPAWLSLAEDKQTLPSITARLLDEEASFFS